MYSKTTIQRYMATTPFGNGTFNEKENRREKNMYFINFSLYLAKERKHHR